MEKLDIKSLTRELKMGLSETKTTAGPREKPAPRKRNQKEPKTSSLDDLIDQVDLLTDYDTKGCGYIDGQIHDLLRQLKVRTKLRIGSLISMLLEKWIREHKEDIIRILKRKPNRFIDP